MLSQLLAATLLFALGSTQSLSAYNADPSTASISGLSAGGFMAAQLGISHSTTFPTGFGVFAGGPYDCARSQYYPSCMNNNTPTTTPANTNIRTWNGTKIDPTSNLATRNIYLHVGTADTVVGLNPMRALQSQLATFAGTRNTLFVALPGQQHTFPTDFDGEGDNACSSAQAPFISNCGYDGAGAVLRQMYGSGLKGRNEGGMKGRLVAYAQSGELGALGLAGTGYVYVPDACAGGGGTVCRVHVALHGCLQSYGQIGDKFMVNTGYTKWADTNDIIVLFPQATVDYTARPIAYFGYPTPNPNACFDWIGWYGTNYDQKGGAQQTAIVNAVNRITSGFRG